ncbi:conserved exported hypothetical protein [Tenacibaculum sp. 190524A05c]|uniref:hypothetical protein n=1 Tax=Tenacibaculum platacis TaxID=3137852 RepID=UPI0031FAC1AB
MKKTITLFTLLFTLYLNAQSFIDEITFTFGIGTSRSEKLDDSTTGNVNLLFNSNNHLFGLHYESGSKLITLSNNPDKYSVANILYGRNFQIKDNFSIELLSGLGIFNYRSYDFTDGKDVNTLNVPVKGNLVFHLNDGNWIDKLGIGISSSVNNQNIVTSFLFLVQFRL